MGQWIATTGAECSKCHRQFEIQYRRVLKGWFWSVRFCPFCGESLVMPTVADGYEKDAEVEP